MTNDELCRIECEMSRERRPLNDVVLKLCHEYRVMRVDRRDLVLLLRDVIRQACHRDDGEIDSMALSAYAGAIKFLAEEGLLEIETEIGRRVIAREVERTDAEPQ